MRRILKNKAGGRNIWNIDWTTNEEINEANDRALKGSTNLKALGYSDYIKREKFKLLISEMSVETLLITIKK
jgi:hypothetical protein